MSRFCSLFSSSGGNSIYIGGADGAVLIDVGVSARQEALAIEAAGISLDSIRAIFVTHEHSDHIRGLRVFAARHHLPVYASRGTLEALNDMGVLDGSFPVDEISEEGLSIAGMDVLPFHTSHDCAESLGYTVRMMDDRRIAVATDLGIITQEVFSAVCGCDLILLESNHDIGMLENGPYPYYLKRRILSARGHLSNEMCAQTIAQLMQQGTTRFVLGHLSRENNVPALAYQTTVAALSEIGAQVGVDYLLDVAAPRCEEPALIF